MDNFKTISVKMNGKETFISSNDEKKKEAWKHSFDQQAASPEKRYEPEDLIEYEKSEDSGNLDAWLEPDRSFKRTKKIPPVFKLFGLAAVSATLIGVTLGFIMLRMLAGIDEGGVQAAQTTDVTLNTAEGSTSPEVSKGAEENQPSIEPVQLKGIQAFVIQGGVVSSEEQATRLQDQFAKAGFPTMVWQGEEDYRIFAGVSNQEATVDSITASMKESNIESYVRPWETPESTVNLEESASTWITDFSSNWNDTLTAVSDQTELGDIVLLWQEWLAENPDSNNTAFEELVQNTNTFVEAVEAQESSAQLQVYLLQMWESYEAVGKE